MPLKRKLWLLSTLLALLFLRILYIAWFGPPVITIVNESAGEVTGVVLRGELFMEAVGSISSGMSATVIVYPAAESGLEMKFVAGGKEVSQNDLAYLQGGMGDCVTLTIDAQLKIRTSERAFCFSPRRAPFLW